MAHDHRQSLWVIACGAILWCYRCGAWRPNIIGRMRWHRPTGPNGENPALADQGLSDGRHNAKPRSADHPEAR